MFDSLIAGLLERAVLTDPLLERRLRLVQLDTAAVAIAALQETCLLLEGGEPVCFGAGDLVNFAAGLSCHWHVHQRVRKRYRFG